MTNAAGDITVVGTQIQNDMTMNGGRNNKTENEDGMKL